MLAARSSAIASTRVSAAEAPGCCTVAPVAFGSASRSAAAVCTTAEASAPALVTRVAAVPSSWSSSATNRWIGSVVELPAVVADSWAASIASRARVVNLSAPNWLIGSFSCRVT